jgi:hypothetical protein
MRMTPTAAEVYRRLMVLKFVILHAETTPSHEALEEYRINYGREKFGELVRALKNRSKKNVRILKLYGLWGDVTPMEKRFLKLYGPKMDRSLHLSYVWRMEAAAVLMWALKFIPIWPKIDESVATERLKDYPIKRLGRTTPGPTLRDFETIQHQSDLLKLWIWRIKTRLNIEDNRPFHAEDPMNPPGLTTYDAVIRYTAKKAYEKGLLTELIDEDFVYAGRPFRDLPTEEFYRAAVVISERHYAMNWLTGLAPGNRWDEVEI